MAKDSRSTFPIIDENGCPVDPTIFPRFTPEGTALQSVYEAFRFTESYGVIFQCNVKYCLGPCEPVSVSSHVSRVITPLFCPQAVCTYGRENLFPKKHLKTAFFGGKKSASPLFGKIWRPNC